MTMTEPDTNLKEGRVVGIAGPVIDVEFPRGSLPEINSAVEFTVTVDGKEIPVLAEVAQQLGGSRVRAVCMRPTDGLQRGTAVRNTGHGITVPVGEKVLGHIWNAWGAPLDVDEDYAEGLERWEIHRPAPPFDELEPSKRVFETGIKVIDLLTPVPGRRQDRPVRRGGRGQDGAHHGDDPPGGPAARRRVGVRRRG